MRYLKASMLKRRVTVHFGPVRVVVPCPDDTLTVRDLAEAAVVRYKKATGRTESDVRIMHLECLRDGGILDMDDRIIEVFDETTDQILAIYDEQSPNGSDDRGYQVLSPPYGNYISPGGSSHSNNFPSSRMTSSSSITTCNVSYPLTNSSSMDMSMMRRTLPNGISSSSMRLDSSSGLPSNGLRISPPCESKPGVSSSSSSSEVTSPPIRSSLRSETTTPNKHRVTMSPEVEKRLAENPERDGRLARSSARKSRISDTFFEAKERLDEMQQSSSSMRSFNYHRRLPLSSCPDDPTKTVITLPDDDETVLGIEVTEVYEDVISNSGRLSAVQIIRIDSTGRVGKDGRLEVGDNIVSIDGRPVYQMSLLRARAYLSDLKMKPAPTLTVARSIESFHQTEEEEKERRRNEIAYSSQKKPIFSALQQANTTQPLGQTTTVRLTKSPNGFGFTVTGRETTKGERLFYIGTVKPNGVALGHLRAGDRLLQINGESTSDMSQPEAVERLKRASIGETVEFIVSRVSTDENKENSGVTTANSGTVTSTPRDSAPTTPSLPKKLLDYEELAFEIPLNSTGSAGLGVSLKARVNVRSDSSRHDCGIFIKNVMHNGAAYKDGRIRVDDRIIGIEELNLLGMSNASAGEAVTKRLKALDPSLKSVKVKVHRKNVLESNDILNTPSLRESYTLEDDKRSSTTSEQPRLDESELITNDPFDREAPGRKSMSEKRGMGVSLDPNHLKVFQEIKHQRQSSAPPPSLTSSSSFHGQAQQRSASQRAAARARSQSVHPREADLTRSASKQRDVEVKEPAKRRSLSVESLNVAATADKRNDVHISHINRNGRQEIDDFYVTSPHPFPPGSPVVIVPRHSTINKERQRRKSVGSAMKSWFGFGSKSRDSSPEKAFDRDRERREKEDMRRAQEHYDRIGRDEDINRSLGTPSSIRRDPRMHPMYSGDHAYQASIPSYHDYELIDRFQAHRYPDGPTVVRPTAHPSTPPPAYHYAIPSSKSYHGPPTVSSSMHPGYGTERVQVNRRAAAPDYYHMFNSWFAYSGGGGVGAAPSIKAAYGNNPRDPHSRQEAPSTRSWARPVPTVYPPATEPSQLYSRFSHY